MTQIHIESQLPMDENQEMCLKLLFDGGDDDDVDEKNNNCGNDEDDDANGEDDCNWCKDDAVVDNIVTVIMMMAMIVLFSLLPPPSHVPLHAVKSPRPLTRQTPTSPIEKRHERLRWCSIYGLGVKPSLRFSVALTLGYHFCSFSTLIV